MRFTWFLNGALIGQTESETGAVASAAEPAKSEAQSKAEKATEATEAGANLTLFTPRPTRCVAELKWPVHAGQYTVVAANEYGASKSSGCIEVQQGLSFCLFASIAISIARF